MDADFTLLYQKYKNQIFSYLYYLSGDKAVAEELSQDVFLKVYLNIGKFQGRSSFKTWIYTIARNAYFDLAKSGQKIQWEPLDSLENTARLPLNQPRGPEESALNTETKEMIARTLDSLSPSYRNLIVLRDILHLSYKEISHITGQELNSIKVSIYRARREFRKIYNGLEGNQ
ncbi:MAG: sigma-70 family RNA polymerase sigma factor [Clostridia bacterium]|nr:sigma-70 family RNA polymerase sigma factor [Clostridia bacterium]